jgi:hypothetical protein
MGLTIEKSRNHESRVTSHESLDREFCKSTRESLQPGYPSTFVILSEAKNPFPATHKNEVSSDSSRKRSHRVLYKTFFLC